MWRPVRRRWRGMGARSEAEARGHFVSWIYRRLGCYVVREFARHRLRRVPAIGLTREQLRARARDGLGRRGDAGAGAGAGLRAADFFAFQAHQLEIRPH